MSLSGLAARDARVFAWCGERSVPVVVTRGGGCRQPPEAMITAHANAGRATRLARDRSPAVHDGHDAVDTLHDREKRG
ncbi:MAG: hypothetical protein A2W00_01185 [Candidatus Eisenbacteria bacterium RBG_16_71_46]|nr:MAG: hypothetical protein A2W00_01185 [Candidatus Eisenbacteria bacterium RBG_16_71_46]OGF23041.1 MAG: hypothetical protein A2V63_08700 [Candidatus Eisenbacteria bacterium RBG_19FT_COMBO_70_11]